MAKKNSEFTESLRIGELLPRHMALMRRLLAGKNLKQAAEEMGYDYERASVIRRSPLFIDKMNEMQTEINKDFVDAESSKVHTSMIRDRLEGLASDAVNVLKGELNNVESGHVRLSAAKEILDRSGYVKEEKVKANLYVEPTAELLNVLKSISEDGNDRDTGKKITNIKK